MPRLLRVHFASIGHRDARLAPMTLDFRHGEGTGADTVLWLRNGGGKSSIINLFYSVFRPSAREFLGSSAEGRARRLDDYVKATDLAYVVTEWDVSPRDSLELFVRGPDNVRLMGQVIAWRGQQRSTDLARFRRLFFSMRALPGVFELEQLPIQGLGEPIESFDAFREFLRDLTLEHPDLEVVSTDSQRNWSSNLDNLGLDPELFRYQLEMNRREGAADEVFRFASTDEFIRFLLDLAFDPGTANQVATNLEAQRLTLRERPRYLLERDLAGAALHELEPLAEAVAALSAARSDLDAVLHRIGGVLVAIREQVSRLRGERAVAHERAVRAQSRSQEAANARDKTQRWIRGLERLASQLEEQETRLAHEQAKQRLDVLGRDVAQARAGASRKAHTARVARVNELRDALRKIELDAAPLREDAEGAGSVLRTLIDMERAQLQARLGTVTSRIEDERRDEASARVQALEADRAAAGLASEIQALDGRIERRDRARERLLTEGLINRREPATEALSRWEARAQDLIEQADAARGRLAAMRAELEEIRGNTEDLIAQRSRTEVEHQTLGDELDSAMQWRGCLAVDARITEVEGVAEADLEALGLGDRLRGEAEAARRQYLDSRLDSAADEHSLQSIRDDGLLAPPRDVGRVVSRLREDRINAHAGPAYLAENAPADERARLLRSDPARFGGVVITGRPDLERSRDIEVEGLQAPVQVSFIERIEVAGRDETVHVLAPEPALHDHAAAQGLGGRLESKLAMSGAREAALRQREQQLEEIAADLGRYLEQYGQGRLDSLAQRTQTAVQRLTLLEASLEDLARRESATNTAIGALAADIERLANQRRASEVAAGRLHAFVDEHEREIESVRDRRMVAREERDAAARQAQEARGHETRCRAAIERLLERAHVLGSRDRDALAEHDRVALFSEASPVAPSEITISLARARQAYETARRIYEHEVSDLKLMWELEQAEAASNEERERYRRLSRGLDHGAIERWASERNLDDEIERLEHDERDQREAVGVARARHEEARSDLAAVRQRREADDLPTDRARPETSHEARELGLGLAGEVERANEASRVAEAEREAATRAASSLERDALDQEKEMTGVVEIVERGAELEIPQATAVTIARDTSELQCAIADLKEQFSAARSRVSRALSAARVRADGVHQVAIDPRFSDLEVSYRRRLSAPADELFEVAGTLAESLRGRLEVIEAELVRYDKDRRVLVDALLQMGDQIETLLRRATRASTLPDTLTGWAGRAYLRIAFAFPEGDEERRARLAPLVDRLVQQARIPDGRELVQLAAKELAGPAGFDVKILKPDTILRPEPIPIIGLSTFSRGQQLTAAILLYCTLVQLRAQSRGRTRGAAHGPRDAGVLILDNPIGTCSSVPLLRLQRAIASQMRVQLIYATGVDDLEALETLPNKIRLRNTHRDRATGEHHVTPDVPGTRLDGQVEAVRILEIPGP